jgi:hypothetical protein
VRVGTEDVGVCQDGVVRQPFPQPFDQLAHTSSLAGGSGPGKAPARSAAYGRGPYEAGPVLPELGSTGPVAGPARRHRGHRGPAGAARRR